MWLPSRNALFAAVHHHYPRQGAHEHPEATRASARSVPARRSRLRRSSSDQRQLFLLAVLLMALVLYFLRVLTPINPLNGVWAAPGGNTPGPTSDCEVVLWKTL